MAWDPEKYDKFRQERLIPMNDIVPLLEIRSNLKIIDLGCGTGVLTEHLARLYPNCTATGIDSSSEMLKKATERKSRNLTFVLQRIEDISGSWDLVFSHSSIQWVDDHKTLIPKLCACVKEGGQLVVQIPNIYQHPVQTLLCETASEQPFRQILSGWLRKPGILPLEKYGEILHEHLGQNIYVFSKVYPYLLKDVDELIDWVYGTSLVPYLERLPPETHALFIKRYKQKLYANLKEDKGKIRYFFNRFFLTGRKASLSHRRINKSKDAS